MRQIVGDLYLRAFLVRALVVKDEVHHPRAVGLEVAVFLPQRWVYLAPRLLRLVGVVVDSLVQQGVGRPLQWGPLHVCHGLDRFGERCDGGR